MVLSVTAYTIFGAYCIRAIENSNIEEINRKNGYAEGERSSRVKRAGNEFIFSGSELSALAPDVRRSSRLIIIKFSFVPAFNEQFENC
jgi:hypothetical protein